MPGHGSGGCRRLVAAVRQRVGKAGRRGGFVAVGVVGLVWLGSTALGAVLQVPVLTTPRDESQVAASNAFLVWSQNGVAHPHLYSVYARHSGGARFRVNHIRTQGFMGGMNGNALVYQQVKGNQSDIKLFNLVTHVRRNPPIGVNTPAWEWHPTTSGGMILFGRFRPSTHRWQIILSLSSRQLIVLADRPEGPGNSPSAVPGQVNGNFAVWQQCTATACNVWEYDIDIGRTTRLPNTTPGRFNYAASVDAAGTVYFAHSGRSCGGAIVEKRPVGGPTSIVVALHSDRDISDSYLATIASQSNLFFAKGNCTTGSSDIYKIVSP
jgi:hypothetical protein